jgi:diguanylate cyclase (GGDEF)-like protein
LFTNCEAHNYLAERNGLSQANGRKRMRDRTVGIGGTLPTRRGLLIALLLVLVAFEVATVTAVVLSQRVRTERALALHTQQLLRAVADSTREDALKFLTQAQKAVQLTEKLFSSGLLSLDQTVQSERYFFDQLSLIPQIDGIYFAGPEGQFLFTKRSSRESMNHFETKLIDFPDGVRRVRRISRDEHFTELDHNVLGDDTYDPRVRPWYLKAHDSAALIWSEPYIFFTSQVPGITVAMRVLDRSGKIVGIVGADVALGAISDFLAAQRVTMDGGAAVLMHQNGDVLAHSLRRKLQITEGDSFRLARLVELDSLASQAVLRLKSEHPNLASLKGSYFDSFTVDGNRIVTMFVPFAPQWPWLMGVYAPEEQFSGTIRAGQQQALLLAIATSIVIILAAFTLSPMLVRLISFFQQRAIRDPLSRLLNRRSFEELAVHPFDQAMQGSKDLSAIMLNIDHFKALTEQYGYAIGDQVIVALAGRIQNALGANELIARLDLKEFAVLLPNANVVEATSVAERLRAAFASMPISTSAGPVEITISLGVAQFHADTTTVLDLLAIAKYRMDRGIREGRNRVIGESTQAPAV